MALPAAMANRRTSELLRPTLFRASSSTNVPSSGAAVPTKWTPGDFGCGGASAGTGLGSRDEFGLRGERARQNAKTKPGRGAQQTRNMLEHN